MVKFEDKGDKKAKLTKFTIVVASIFSLRNKFDNIIVKFEVLCIVFQRKKGEFHE